jgi:hypothetical protein
MRKPIDPAARCKTRGLSLPPDLEKYASKRAFDAGISFSQYLQLFIHLDQQEDLLPRALTAKLKAAKQ